MSLVRNGVRDVRTLRPGSDGPQKSRRVGDVLEDAAADRDVVHWKVGQVALEVADDAVRPRVRVRSVERRVGARARKQIAQQTRACAHVEHALCGADPGSDDLVALGPEPSLDARCRLRRSACRWTLGGTRMFSGRPCAAAHASGGERVLLAHAQMMPRRTDPRPVLLPSRSDVSTAAALRLGEAVVVTPGERDFVVCAPSGASFGRAREIWLENVGFLVRGDEKVVLGTVIATRPAKVARKNGWSAIRADGQGGCFYRATTGVCARAALFARLVDGRIDAFGITDGDPMTSARDMETVRPARDLPVYGPQRKSWRGDMGGLNYQIASGPATLDAIRRVLERHPGHVIVDGSDDWNAPVHCRPELLAFRYGTRPVAWWHAGASGQTVSGALFDAAAWARFRRAFAAEWGFSPERCPWQPVGPERPPCGCYRGEGLAVYRF